LCGLVGCMSMEEMLASQDPEIHGWGEDWAVDVVADRYSQTPLEKKLEVLKQIKDQERLAKIYVGKRTAPEVKAEVAKRITEEKAFLYILSHAQSEDDVKMATAGIKSDAGRMGAANALLLIPTAERRKAADGLMDGFAKQDMLCEYLLGKAKTLCADKDKKERTQRWYREDEQELEREKKAWMLMLEYVQSRDALDMLDHFHNERQTQSISALGLGRAVGKRDNVLRIRDNKLAQVKKAREAAIEAEARAKEQERLKVEAKIKTEAFARCLEALRPKENDIVALKQKAAKFKRDTLVMKGFYVGMPIEDAKTLVWGIAGKVDPKKEWTEKDNVTNEVMMALGGIVCKSDKGLTLAGGGVDADKNGAVTRIVFTRDQADALFDVKGVDGKLFCQQLAESYDNIEGFDYSAVQVEDTDAKRRYERQWTMNAFMANSASMAFSAGLNAPEFKKWIDCYHCESKQGWKLKVFAEAKNDESFLVLEKTQRVDRRKFD